MADSQDDHNSSSNGNNNFGGPLFYVNHGMFQPGTGMPPPQHPFMHAATHPLALHPYMTFAAQFPHFHFPHPHLLQQAQMSGQALQHMAQFPHGLQPPPLMSPSEGHVEAFQQSSPRSGPRVPKRDGGSNGSTPSPSSVSHSGPTSLDPKESETATALLELFKNPVTDDTVKSRKRPPPQRKSEARQTSRWTREEDELLKAGVDALGPRDWKRISEEFLGGRRRDVQCYQRWERTLKPGVKTGPWTREEDEMLRKCIAEGMTKWSEIAKRIPGRLSKRVRERWTCQLNPARLDKEVAPWTAAEETILFGAQQKLGNRWVEIAKLLPGRSENDVKNHAYCEMRKRQRKESKHTSSSSQSGRYSVYVPDSAQDQAKVAQVFSIMQQALEEDCT